MFQTREFLRCSQTRSDKADHILAQSSDSLAIVKPSSKYSAEKNKQTNGSCSSGTSVMLNSTNV
jgi:hypothetical protein